MMAVEAAKSKETVRDERLCARLVKQIVPHR